MARDKRRILVVHNRYQQPGGEDVVFESESALLARSGHTVRKLALDNAAIGELTSPGQRLRLAAETVWSRRAAHLVRREIREFGPDILHAHNTFPLWSPSIFDAATEEGVAVVATLHNYRLICPSANLYRDGGVCTDCVGRRIPWPAVVHACYRDSRVQTAAVTAMLSLNNLRHTFDTDVHAFIALTPSARAELVAGGLRADLVHIKPNFVDPDPGTSTAPRSGFLFAGRLTEDKGVGTLIDAARQLRATGIEIRVAGAGPLEGALRDAAQQLPGLHVLGQVSRQQLYEELGRSVAALVPSQWYEPFGLVVAEAYATGTPVIASRMGGLTDLVSTRTGMLIAPANADELAAAMRWATEHSDAMLETGHAARALFEKEFSAPRNLERLLEIYDAALERATAVQ